MRTFYVVTVLNWTPTFEWYMTRFAVENGHQEDIFVNEIGLCAQNISIILGAKFVNTIGRAYVIM